MIAHIGAQIERLASLCSTVPGSSTNGWTIDVWELSEEAEAALVDAYRVLIAPTIDDEVRSLLTGEGIDLNLLFFNDGESGESGRRDTVTRSDMIEIAAAASLVASEGASIENIHLPNVPKGSRKQSASGLDVSVIFLDDTGDPTKLGDNERLILCSVKHTVANCADLRQKLVRSVTDDLSVPYLVQELRVLHGRLEERGIDASRVFLILNSGEAGWSEHVLMMAVGAVDVSERTDIAGQMDRLPASDPGLRHFRQLLITDLKSLNKRVSI